jgi:anti-sigma B factor antagonist
MDADHLRTSTLETAPGQWRIEVDGELDSSTCPEFLSSGVDLIDQGATSLVLGMKGASFVDSSGLRAIIELTQRLEDKGGGLQIDGLSPAAERILEVTGLLERYRSPD